MAPGKTNDRLAEIRARVARRAAQEPESTAPQPREIAREAPAETSAPDTATLAAASAHFLGAAEHLIQGRTVESIPIGLIAPDERPAMRQPRLLPPPNELILHGEPAPQYRALVTELLGLGQSLRERQIQPIIVYRGASSSYPTARYLILVGHRRWTAAVLVGLDSLDAVVVDAPDISERVRIQYAENEAREEFSDMERAWALVQMKHALNDAPWEMVESQFGISRTRRHELTRLLALTPEQQRQVALLRLQETQARPLHTGIRNNELTTAQVDAVLYRLAQIASERAAAAERSDEGSGAVKRSGIDGPTVARLVARAQRTASPMAAVAATPTPRWLPPLREQITRTNQSLRRTANRVESLGGQDSVALLNDLSDLAATVMALIQQMQADQRDGDYPSEEAEDLRYE